jgi:uncharacterized protein (TIGR00159 family)
VIPFLVERAGQLLRDAWHFLSVDFHPVWDTLDLLLLFVAVYWVLLLIKGTRAVQIMIGLMALGAARLLADFLQLATLSWVLGGFLQWSPIIIVVLFQDDIRRALARVGRGFFPRMSERRESQILEEVVRASQILAQKRVGALIVLERETTLDDHIEVGARLDATVTKDLLVSIFLPYSPLHDGAVVVQDGRLAFAGCILPLTLRTDLPEGVGTRHRAAVGITEETDAVVIVVSEETATISVVMGGEMTRGLDAPELRVVLRDYMTRGPGEPQPDEDEAAPTEAGAEAAEAAAAGAEEPGEAGPEEAAGGPRAQGEPERPRAAARRADGAVVSR